MKKKHTALLKQIQSEIPKEYIRDLMMTVDRYAFIKDLMELGINDPEFPEEKKSYYKNMLASGQMDIQDQEVNPEIELKIDTFINARIKEEVEKGNLPKSAFKHLFKKTRKYVKRSKDVSGVAEPAG